MWLGLNLSKKRSTPQQTNYSPATDVRSITTTDLLCWSFQTTRAMQHLASHKILHANLCAENIMLCEDNVVKICNFGLSKSMYQSGIGKNRVRKNKLFLYFNDKPKFSHVLFKKFMYSQMNNSNGWPWRLWENKCIAYIQMVTKTFYNLIWFHNIKHFNFNHHLVWSFGIVLWEFFTLGETPYSDWEKGDDLYYKLNKGIRMKWPEYATEDM